MSRHLKYIKNIVVNNVTDYGNGIPLQFEADIVCLTEAGFATVIEIKVSKSDLMADKKKFHIKLLNEDGYINEKVNYFRAVKKFYYAVPKGMEVFASENIPPFAGILVVDKVGDWFVTEVYREAAIIGSYKWSEKERSALLRIASIRYWSLRGKSNE